MSQKTKEKIVIPRRKFITGAGKIAAGAAIGIGTLGMVACSNSSKETSAEGNTQWPWPYEKLDPKAVAKVGYENYFKGGCMYGAASALVLALQNAVGEPFNGIPIDMFKYGAGGVAGWGTLCGSLNGACAVIAMVSKDHAQINNELLGWYTQTEFPSTNHDEYAKFKGQQKTVSNSPLCHQSVSRWCKATGFEVGDDERKDRCAKLTGDVAAKTVELLNAYFDNSFAAVYKPADDFASCLDCHGGKDIVGKMSCTDCHEPHNQ